MPIDTGSATMMIILMPLGIPNPLIITRLYISNKRSQWGGLSWCSCGYGRFHNVSITNWWIYRFLLPVFEWTDMFRVFTVEFTMFRKIGHQYMRLNTEKSYGTSQLIHCDWRNFISSQCTLFMHSRYFSYI